MVVRCLNSRSAHEIAKCLLTNRGPMFVSINQGIPNRAILFSRNISAMSVDDVIDVRMALVCLGPRSVIIKIAWSPYCVFGNVPRMPIATNSVGQDAENSWRRLL